MAGQERMEKPNTPKTRPIPACVEAGSACAGLLAECAARTEERAQNDALRAENHKFREALKDIEFVMDGKEDADDGRPNDAMKIMSVVRTALASSHSSPISEVK